MNKLMERETIFLILNIPLLLPEMYQHVRETKWHSQIIGNNFDWAEISDWIPTILFHSLLII